MIPNLHELANAPGFGKAQTALQKAGCWDDGAGTGEPQEWRVTLTALRPVSVEVTVTAMDADEAEELAHDMAHDPKLYWMSDGEPLEQIEADAEPMKGKAV